MDIALLSCHGNRLEQQQAETRTDHVSIPTEHHTGSPLDSKTDEHSTSDVLNFVSRMRLLLHEWQRGFITHARGSLNSGGQ